MATHDFVDKKFFKIYIFANYSISMDWELRDDRTNVTTNIKGMKEVEIHDNGTVEIYTAVVLMRIALNKPVWVWYLTGQMFESKKAFSEFVASQNGTVASIREKDTFTGVDGDVYDINTEEAMYYTREYVENLKDFRKFFPVWFLKDYSANKFGELLRHSTGNVTRRRVEDEYQRTDTFTFEKRTSWHVHRLMYLSWGYSETSIDGLVIDHINRKKNDNSFGNLRVATPTENAKNRKVRYYNGVKLECGVIVKSNKSFYVKITNFDGKGNGNNFICRGFKTIESANICANDIYGLDRTRPDFAEYLLDTYDFEYVPKPPICELFTTDITESVTIYTMTRSRDFMKIQNGKTPQFFRADTNVPLTPTVSSDGYSRLQFNGKTFHTHLIVAYLLGYTESMSGYFNSHFVVNHKNGKRDDYRPENLECISRRVNCVKNLTPSKPRITQTGQNYYYIPRISVHKNITGTYVQFDTEKNANDAVAKFHEKKLAALENLAKQTLLELEKANIQYSHDSFAKKELELMKTMFTKATLDSWLK